jgi:hypothetical protein
MNNKYPTFFLTWFNKFSQVPYPGCEVALNLPLRNLMGRCIMGQGLQSNTPHAILGPKKKNHFKSRSETATRSTQLWKKNCLAFLKVACPYSLY